MKKTLLCNIRMSEGAEKKVYASEDKYIPVSDTPVCYPVMAFLEKVIKQDDEIKAVLLAKMDSTGRYEDNILSCKAEIDEVARKTGAKIQVDVIYTPFREDAKTHGDLLMQIVEKIEPGTEIIMDMTYGPKDLTIVEFSALNFANRYLDCEIGEIMYGQAVFVDGKPTDTRICEMGSLFYLNSIISDVRSIDPVKSIEMLRALLEM